MRGTIINGEVREWLKRAASKAAIPERVSGVRIPPSPPSKQSAISNQRSALSKPNSPFSASSVDSERMALFGDANLGLLQNVSDGVDHCFGCFIGNVMAAIWHDHLVPS